MKIPEGWPTEEMLFAAREACDDMFQIDFIRAFKAAMEAAPTPPLSDLRKEAADWINRDRYMNSVAPSTTPPAQEIGLSHLFQWCAPGDRQKPVWLLMFDDRDRGYNYYEVESDAIRDFNRSEGLGWNCHLFALMPRKPAQEDDPRLVSYGVNLETCTLNYKGEEYYFDRVANAAQEDEPVAWVNGSSLISERIDAERGLHWALRDQHTWRGIKTDYHNTPLYLRPQSDKLRDAAEDALALLIDLTKNSPYDFLEIENLRKALEGKS